MPRSAIAATNCIAAARAPIGVTKQKVPAARNVVDPYLRLDEIPDAGPELSLSRIFPSSLAQLGLQEVPKPCFDRFNRVVRFRIPQLLRLLNKS